MALDLNDKTSNGNNLTNSGATEATTNLPFAQSTSAAIFTASGSNFMSAVDAASLKPSANFTIEFWVKPASTPASYANIFQSYSENTNQAGIIVGLLSSNKIQFISGRNTGNVEGTDFKNLTSVNTITNDNSTWTHIACVYDSTNMYIYFNGTLDTSVAWANNPGYAATNYVRIGCRNITGTNDFFWDGVIDDVRLWNTDRTQTQISNNKDIELTGSETNLQAYWPYESTLGTTTSTSTSSSTSTSTSTTSTSSSTSSSSSTSTTSTSTSTSTSTTSTSTSTTSTSSSTSTISISTSTSTSTSTTSTSSSTTTTLPIPFTVDDGGQSNDLQFIIDHGDFTYL